MHGSRRQAPGGLIEPHYLRIGGYWYPRGGMPIDVFWQTGTCPPASGCPIRASPRIAAVASTGGSATATIFRYIRRLARDGRLR